MVIPVVDLDSGMDSEGQRIAFSCRRCLVQAEGRSVLVIEFRRERQVYVQVAPRHVGIAASLHLLAGGRVAALITGHIPVSARRVRYGE